MPRSTAARAFVGFAVVALCGCGDAPERALSVVEDRIEASFPDVRTITTDSLSAWLADPAREAPRLLDVRAPEEYAVSHIPGAVRVAPGSGGQHLPEGPALDAPVVVYCSVGLRSAEMARALVARGYTNVANLQGSIFRWANEGRPLVQGETPTDVVHPYDRIWGRMLRADRRAPLPP